MEPLSKGAGSSGTVPPAEILTRAGVRCMPLPTPFPVGRVNSYLLRAPTPLRDGEVGHRTALVDVGPRSERTLAALVKALAENGLSLEDIDALLVTHPHYDHAGGAADLARRYGWPVYCHEAAVRVDMLAHRQGFHDLMERFGAPEDLVQLYVLSHGMADQVGEPLSAVPTLRTLADGEEIYAGGLALEAIHTPGHDAAHLGYLAREAGLLCVGDLLLGHITPNPLPHFAPGTSLGREPSIPLYLASLDRVEALGPLVGLTGHGALLPDIAEAARRARRHIHRRSEAVLGLCHEHPGATVAALAALAFPDVDVIGQLLAFSEILAHCDYLVTQDRLRLSEDSGVVSPLD